jgi:queuine tRNA-ribosyltransferase
VQLSVQATDGAARAGSLHTRRGVLPTPLFMPVGTRGAVRTLDTTDLERLGLRIVLGNTYHLMLRPGAEAVAARGGLHRFMDWSGHLLTDSGGFQIFSLGPRVDDDGATFQSTYDGSSHHLGPERAVEVQAQLGADIQMALDVCPGLPAPPAVISEATERTHRWAERARRRWHEVAETRPVHQEQFGIVQGGTDPALRRRSALAITGIGFDGYALGGLSVGESRAEMVPAIAAAAELLPADQPRYLMGVGDPAGLIEGVANGIDLFDCVLPTRLARHGTVLTDGGRLNLRNARFAGDDGPLDAEAAALDRCPLTERYSRAYLRHLLQVHELTAMRILTLHNLWWLGRLMDRARAAIVGGSFAAFRGDVLEIWGGR